MKRKLYLGAVLALVAIWAGAVVSEEPKAGKPDAVTAPYVHVVVFTLKKDAPKDAAEQIIADCQGMLTKVPTVRGLKVGRPADKATPEVAKKNYDVGLVVFFDDFDGLKTYLDHEQHQKFLQKHGGQVDLEKLLVFDFINQKK
jgi:hypothetical protein